MKCEWAKYKDVLALGGFDITHHLMMYFLKPIEQGLDVKFTGGIHRGCLRVQASTTERSRRSKDLKGKRIGVPGMGTPPLSLPIACWERMASTRRKTLPGWCFPPANWGSRWKRAKVDAVADSEPIGSMLLAQGKVRNVADQATDMPYKEEYCCAVIVNGKYLKSKNPKATAAAHARLLKGAKWVETNPAAAAQLSVEKEISRPRIPELNTVAISHLRYIPSVSGAETAVKSAAAEMKTAGMISARALMSRRWRQKPSSTWTAFRTNGSKRCQVEKVAGGAIAARTGYPRNLPDES